jgi:hypothetical protein
MKPKILAMDNERCEVKELWRGIEVALPGAGVLAIKA